MSGSDLVAGYLPGIDILHGVSVSAVAHEIRSVLGPNGTGKSTLLKVLFGFLPARAGSILLGDAPLRDAAPHAMGKRGVAYLPQRPSLFPYLSVEINLRLGTWGFRRAKARVRERIDRAFEQFPMLKEKRRQPAGTMSGGQQRQLEIARSLLSEPSVFLIDEPTASVEPRVSAEIYGIVANLARSGMAILLVDQNVKAALGIADYVYVMRTGALYAEGARNLFQGDVDALVSEWLYTRKEE